MDDNKLICFFIGLATAVFLYFTVMTLSEDYYDHQKFIANPEEYNKLLLIRRNGGVFK